MPKLLALVACFFGVGLFTAALVFMDGALLPVAAVLLLLACAALLFHIADRIDTWLPFLVKRDAPLEEGEEKWT